MAEAGKNGAGGAATTALALVERGRVRFQGLPAQRRNWLLAGGAMLLAVIAGLAWYGNRPEWKVLYAGLEGRDAATVEQELGAAGVAFRPSANGEGVEVPAELLDKARMEVAAKGMPQTGRLGFELFDKPNWVGSEFDERVNYQRALEGELEHTIGSLGEVREARVHLALPQPSLFTQEEKPAKASVVLRLRRPHMADEQIEAIRRLVAGAVDGLAPDGVTLVDADGRLDFSQHGRSQNEGDAEQAMEAKLVAMLEPLAGAGNVRAVVNVAYDEGREERTDEVYDPTQTATLSMQKTEQTSGNAVKPQGVPGTASNTPAAAPAGAVQGSAQAAAPGVPPLLQANTTKKDGLPVYPQTGLGTSQTMEQENGSYAVTKHLMHREDGPGRMQRLTVAVVVNDREVTEGEAKLAHTVWKPRTSEEMHRLEGLAQAAVGFEAKRGDSVVVENVSFSGNAVAAQPAGIEKVMDEAKGLVREQPGALRIAMLGGLGLLVVLFVLRPVSRQMVAMLKEPMPLAAGTSGLSLQAGGVGDREQEESAALLLSAQGEGIPGKPPSERVGEFIRDKPLETTRLLENWITQKEEG